MITKSLQAALLLYGVAACIAALVAGLMRLLILIVRRIGGAPERS